MILIDTHVLLWLDRGGPELGRRARTLADDALTQGHLWVSSITFCEVAVLVVKRRITLRTPIVEWRSDLLRRGVRERMLDGTLAIQAVMLERFHKDPGDRIIVATALALEMPLLTADERILAWPGSLRCVDARR